MGDLENKKIFSNNFRYFLELNNKEKIDISKDLDIPYTTVVSWYNGTFYPRIDKIDLLAKYFNIEKSKLIDKWDIYNDIDNSAKLTKYIMELANNKIEEELLIKSTMLENPNQIKVLELVNMYLKEQGDFYTKDDKGKWINNK